MKKHFAPLLLAISLLVTLLTGCSALRTFEKDLQVVLNVNGDYFGSYTVNIFNNAIVPEPKAPDGKRFIGWSAHEGACSAEELVSENKALIRYNDVKAFAAKDTLSVTLYAAFEELPRRDLVIAWYAKTSTSGLDQAAMDAFQEKLNAYLTSQGYKPAEMDIVIRAYDGGVADSCAQILRDGDVDIMIGWSTTKNLTETGGLVKGQDFLENVGSINIGSKERYAARKTDTDLSKLVYTWIQQEFGAGAQDKEAGEYDLVIAWYDKAATSGLDQAAMDAFQEKLNAYLTAQGHDTGKLQILLRGYQGNVADSCAEIKKDNDVDIMVGWSSSSNLAENGGFVEGTDFLENIGSITIGSKERYAARKTDTDLSKLVYAWIQQEYGAASEDGYDLVIAWYDKVATSGLSQSTMDTFQKRLNTYLASQGYKPEEMRILLRGYTGSVSKSCGGILDDGDVDIMIGWSSSKNLSESGGMTQGVDFLVNNGKIKLGSKERYAARITDTDLSKLVYNWIVRMYTVPAPAPAGPQDLIIAWYSKTATSGLDQAAMDAFRENLNAYLTTQGYDPEELSILLRSYNGSVGTTCGAIKDDGDVDIMIGWSTTSNLTESGGMAEGVDFLENTGGIQVGSKERYAARITDTELSQLVYDWILWAYGDAEEPTDPTEPVDPTDPTEPDDPGVTKERVVVAWYAKTSTSGLDQAAMDTFQEKLNAYLATQESFDSEKMELVLRPYDGSVGDTCAAIRADGDVDIMVGWSTSKNLVDAGGFVEGEDFLENVGSIQIGSKERYAARKTNTDLAKLVYAWILQEYDTTPEPTDPTDPTDPTEPEIPDDPKQSVVIAWYAKTATSGLDQAAMDAFRGKLNTYLTSQNYDLEKVELTLRPYDGTVGDTCAAIQAAGDVDIMIGWSTSKNLVDAGGFVEGVDFLENVGSIQVGSKERYAARKTDTDLSKLVYAWILQEYDVTSGPTDPTEPEIPDMPVQNLVVAWYAKTGTSGLDQAAMDAFQGNLLAYLAEQGYNLEKINLTLRGYDGSVGETCAAIQADGDVDIMIGWSSSKNLVDAGGFVEGVDFLENVSAIKVGSKERYAARKTDTELCRLVFAWLRTTYGA